MKGKSLVYYKLSEAYRLNKIAKMGNYKLYKEKNRLIIESLGIIYENKIPTISCKAQKEKYKGEWIKIDIYFDDYVENYHFSFHMPLNMESKISKYIGID